MATKGVLSQVLNNATLKQPYDNPQLNVEKKPALGPSFTFMTDTTLWFSRRDVESEEPDAPDTQQYCIEVLKSRVKVGRH